MKKNHFLQQNKVKCTEINTKVIVKSVYPKRMFPPPQDYIMVIPAVQFRSEVLDVLPVDKSAEFISKCGKDQFYIE